MPALSCPNCGDTVDARMAAFRHVVCPSCGTSLLREDDVVRNAGQAGVMHDAPLLFGLGDMVRLGDETYRILGHARFSYGRGWWDEFQGRDGHGNAVWLSIDEGDVAIQFPLSTRNYPRHKTPPRIGALIQSDGEHFTVTEHDSAECTALRGGFDEQLTVGETYDFVNCSGDDGRLLSGEFWPEGRAWFIGGWVDPFDLIVDRAP